ncbi:MAG: PKD domain-containing protein, partial [Armatimonadetes bacterium]|nr:PKD domain-containing protein [Armatimonadota bacterium]
MDIFVAKMDTNGNWLWATKAGGISQDIGYGITIDDTGNSYVTGCFEETATFGSFSLTSSGHSDIFVAKLESTSTLLFTDFISYITSGFALLTVNFTDLSQGNIINWQWDFQNDGIFDSFEQDPTYAYTQAGIYDVKLKISNETQVDSLIKYEYITVNPGNAIYGYAFLENQSYHKGIKILFERTVPSSYIDSTFTDSTGYFILGVPEGIYDITYSKNTFHPIYKYDEILYSNTTLPDVTLLDTPATLLVPSVYSSIQYAIEESFPGDTILVAPGTYIENVDFLGKSINLFSYYATTLDTTYISQTIIDGSNTGYAVKFNTLEDTLSLINGFTLTTNGNNKGVYCYSASPKITNSIITDNFGGVCIYQSDLILENVYIINNNYGNRGAGIYCNNSNPILRNVTIHSNITSSNGGGIYCENTSMTLSNCSINQNSSIYGGGIYCKDNSIMILSNCSINQNYSSYYGGGIYCYYYSSIILNNTILAGNTTNQSHGGGIYCSSASNLDINNCTIINNHTSDDGSAIYLQSSSSNADISNSIISDNSGNYAIYVSSGTITIDYSDFWNNGVGNFYNCGQWVGVNVTTNANGDSCDAYYNIQVEPSFVNTANGEYSLTSISPCIDAGDPSSPLDPDGTISDMGAFFYDQNQPSADFIANIMSGTSPLIIDFSDLSSMGLSGNPILEWNWDFNSDGTIDSQAQNPQWTYYERGNYTVTLTIFDGTYVDAEIKEDYISLLNSAPIIQNPLIDFSFDEDTSDSSIDLFSVFDDPDLLYGDSLSFSYSGNDSILVEILNGVVTFTPLPDWFGAENITFTATDDSLVFISDDVLVTIINVNDPPVINFPTDFTFYEDSLETYDFTQYITDIDNSLNDISLTWSGNDTINIVQDGWEITFSSNFQNWNGLESVTFFFNDNSDNIRISKNNKIREKLKSEFTDDIVSETIDVICLPVNDPPTIILPDYFTFTEDSTLVEDFAVYIDDVDPDVLTLSVTGNTEITVDIVGTIVTFGASANWNGMETLTFTVDDNQTRATASDDVDVIVTPMNDPPTIVLPDDFTFVEDSTSVADFEPYIFDEEGDPLTLSVAGNDSIIVDITDFIVTFSALPDWNGTEILTFTVDDNVTRATASDSVYVIVTPVNDPPTIILPDYFTFAEDSTLVEDFAVYIDDVDP